MTGEVSIGDFMEVKGWKAVGNRLSDQMLAAVKEIELNESRLLPKAEPAAPPPKQTSLFGDDATPRTLRLDPADKKMYKADTMRLQMMEAIKKPTAPGIP